MAAPGFFVPVTRALAQQAGRVYRVALLGLLPRASGTPFLNALSGGLRQLGYVEGRNLVLEYHTADGDLARLPQVAANVVRLHFDAIVTTTNETTEAAKQATSSVPIVMVIGGDPVRTGLIASIARPGGNITGLTFDAAPETYAKPLEFLKEISPALSRVAVLRSTGSTWEPRWASARDMGRKMAIDLDPIELRGVHDIALAFTTMRQRDVRAFLFWPDPVTYPARREIAELAIKDGLLSASLVGQYADSGGLLAYGPSLGDLFRRSATYVDKVLRGARPADLPVEQPAKYELVVNVRTAKALGVTIPQSLLVRADRVIGD
jgi:putative tryptophan/tyrosine transport system substrate-binding protein